MPANSDRDASPWPATAPPTAGSPSGTVDTPATVHARPRSDRPVVERSSTTEARPPAEARPRVVLAPEVTVDVDEGSAEGGMTPIEPSPESALPDDREVRPGSAADDLTMVEEADDARESVGVDTVSVDGRAGRRLADGTRSLSGGAAITSRHRHDPVARSFGLGRPAHAGPTRGPARPAPRRQDRARATTPPRRLLPCAGRCRNLAAPARTQRPITLPPSFGRSTAVPSEPESTGETPQRPGPETMPDTMPDSMPMSTARSSGRTAPILEPRRIARHRPPRHRPTTSLRPVRRRPIEASARPPKECPVPVTASRRFGCRPTSRVRCRRAVYRRSPSPGTRSGEQAGSAHQRIERRPQRCRRSHPRVLRQASAPQHREPVQSRAALVTGDLAVGAPAPTMGATADEAGSEAARRASPVDPAPVEQVGLPVNTGLVGLEALLVSRTAVPQLLRGRHLHLPQPAMSTEVPTATVGVHREPASPAMEAASSDSVSSDGTVRRHRTARLPAGQASTPYRSPPRA